MKMTSEQKIMKISGRYPRNGVRLSLEGPKNRTISFLLNMVDLSFHVAMNPRQCRCTNNSRSSISSSLSPTISESILVGRRKAIICPWSRLTRERIIQLCQQNIYLFARKAQHPYKYMLISLNWQQKIAYERWCALVFSWSWSTTSLDQISSKQKF